ncbi:hypothetical protein [Microbulbifer sp. SAOS-129_SWC]|uniref:hypothetical protein n=1 Tax=Microbulbifer sp. SAOS-129_SWC TaxID=3145235 RepID=UPI0032165F8A
MQRREPTLDGSSPPIEPQLDNKPIGRGARSAGPLPTPAATAAPEERSGGGVSVVGVVALILALAGLGAAAFLYTQWQESRAQLVDADKRIAELEKRFEMSDEETSASAEVLTAKVKDNASEIRKLWGVSYDTNRKDIASNKNVTAANKKALASLSSQVGGLKDSLKKVAAVESALAELRKSATASDRQTKDTLNKMERQLASVRTELTARVGANEEAVESMDAYRRSVNKDLVQLRDAVRSLQNGGSTASSM